MKWLTNFERVQEIQQQVIWQPIMELEPRAFIPEVRVTGRPRWWPVGLPRGCRLIWSSARHPAAALRTAVCSVRMTHIGWFYNHLYQSLKSKLKLYTFSDIIVWWSRKTIAFRARRDGDEAMLQCDAKKRDGDGALFLSIASWHRFIAIASGLKSDGPSRLSYQSAKHLRFAWIITICSENCWSYFYKRH